MAVTERSRHEMVKRLEEALGEEAAMTLVEHLPPVGWGDVARRSDLAAFDPRLEQIHRRFEEVDRRFEEVDRRFDQVDARFEEVDRRFEEVDRRFDQVDARFEEVDRRFDQVDARFEDLEARLGARFEQGLAQLETRISNELRRQMWGMIVAFVSAMVAISGVLLAAVRISAP